MSADRIDLLAQTIWDYLNFRTPLEKSDAILVLGSHDARVASHAAKLYHQGWAPKLVFSGGLSPFTAKIFAVSEAAAFAEVALKEGVPREAILLEDQSSNTQENFEYSMRMFAERNEVPKKLILVQKPNMLRRVYATARKLYPHIEIRATSHDISFREAPTAYVTREMFLHELVGDMQRIALYPEKGFIIPQEMDPRAWAAYEELKSLGYTGNLAKSE